MPKPINFHCLWIVMSLIALPAFAQPSGAIPGASPSRNGPEANIQTSTSKGLKIFNIVNPFKPKVPEQVETSSSSGPRGELYNPPQVDKKLLLNFAPDPDAGLSEGVELYPEPKPRLESENMFAGLGKPKLSVSDLPQVEINGIIWNSDQPQAIINQQILNIGDNVNGMQIVGVSKRGVHVKYLEQIFILEMEKNQSSLKYSVNSYNDPF